MLEVEGLSTILPLIHGNASANSEEGETVGEIPVVRCYDEDAVNLSLAICKRVLVSHDCA